MNHVDLELLVPRPFRDLVIKSGCWRFIPQVDNIVLLWQIVWVFDQDETVLVGVDAVRYSQPDSVEDEFTDSLSLGLFHERKPN